MPSHHVYATDILHFLIIT